MRRKLANNVKLEGEEQRETYPVPLSITIAGIRCAILLYFAEYRLVLVGQQWQVLTSAAKLSKEQSSRCEVDGRVAQHKIGGKVRHGPADVSCVVERRTDYECC